ncbi:MAG: alpha/beta hydrolase family protein [Promethearchaeota archaeon]
MRFRVLFLILPSFVIVSCILTYILFINLNNLVLGIIFSIISIFVGLILFKTGIHSTLSHFKNISKDTIDIQKVEITLDDGVKTVGNFYRSVFETVLTPNGQRYPEPRPVIIFFHGFWTRKEIYEVNLINLAHLGYLAVAFDQRGHGEAGGKKNDWYKLYNDVETIIDSVCSFEDTKVGSLCCIGISMGGTSVLTKCYQDERVAMVVGISALHNADLLLEAKFRFLSAGWFVSHQISKVKDKRALKICARYFLKSDPKFNKDRVYLIHGNNDKIFPPSLTFKLNKEQANIPDNHAILLKNCGHSLEGQDLLIFGIIVKWILENGAMNLKIVNNSKS